MAFEGRNNILVVVRVPTWLEVEGLLGELAALAAAEGDDSSCCSWLGEVAESDDELLEAALG